MITSLPQQRKGKRTKKGVKDILRQERRNPKKLPWRTRLGMRKDHRRGSRPQRQTRKEPAQQLAKMIPQLTTFLQHRLERKTFSRTLQQGFIGWKSGRSTTQGRRKFSLGRQDRSPMSACLVSSSFVPSLPTVEGFLLPFFSYLRLLFLLSIAMLHSVPSCPVLT